MDRLTSRELQALLATLRTLYVIHTPTAFASALLKAPLRFTAVNHVVWHSPRAAGYRTGSCGVVLQAGRLSHRFDRQLRRRQAGT